MKKKYNPFKMWGSYVGAIILVFFFPLIDYGIYTTIPEILNDLTFAQIITFAPIGFLAGWGIHSLIRKLRK